MAENYCRPDGGAYRIVNFVEIVISTFLVYTEIVIFQFADDEYHQ